MNYSQQRIYELLENLFIKKNSTFSVEDFLKDNNNEVKELINLLTNHNPFTGMYNANIKYEEIINNDPNTTGAYYHSQHLIGYSLSFIESIVKNPKDIGLLLDTIYHEQRHHEQDWNNLGQQETYNGVNLKEIYTAMFEAPISESEMEELHKFATKHDLLKLKISEKKIRELQFGAYYANKAEIDARNSAFKQTIQTFEIMINDPDCPKELKKNLKSSLKKYKETNKYIKIDNEPSMQQFIKLEEKIKKVLFEAIRSEKDLDKETYDQLLNGVLSYITQHLTLEENLEIAGWAIKNHYIKLIDKIDISRSLSGQQKDIDKFLLKITDQNLVDSYNFQPIADMLAPLKQNKKEEALQQLSLYQAEMRKPLVLLDNLLLGKIGTDTITPKHISIATSNYINYTEAIGKIDDADKFTDTKNKLRMLIYNTSILSEDEKEHLLKLYNRFDKVQTKVQNSKHIDQAEVSL